MSIVGGLFLGILGMAVIIFFPENKWIMAAVPLTGLLAGWLGAYVAAEPYVDLREQYDALIATAASGGLVSGSSDEEKAALKSLAERMEAEGARLLEESAGVGEDGLRLAQVAEYLRGEVASLRKINELK
jgi:hypothetical protein